MGGFFNKNLSDEVGTAGWSLWDLVRYLAITLGVFGIHGAGDL